MPDDHIRQSFEIWLRDRVGKLIHREPDLSRERDGRYVNIDHQRRWEAWQAAVKWYSEVV